jgi:hypothetical protein
MTTTIRSVAHMGVALSVQCVLQQNLAIQTTSWGLSQATM